MDEQIRISILIFKRWLQKLPCYVGLKLPKHYMEQKAMYDFEIDRISAEKKQTKKSDFEKCDIPLTIRLNELKELIQSTKKTAAIIYPFFDINSTFRYRVYNICQILKKSEKYGAVYFFPYELKEAAKFINGIDAAIICRTEYSKDMEKAVRFIKRHKKTILFDIDDLLFSPDYFKYLLDKIGNSQNIENNLEPALAATGKYYLMAKLCDGFISTNEFLGKLLLKKFGKPFKSIPNFLNEEQKSVKDAEKYGDFTLGYFSGTNTHNKDFLEAWSGIKRLLTEYEDIRLKITGRLTLPEDAGVFMKSKRITQSPPVDFITLQTLYGKVHVNVVPLTPGLFNDCKSELKFFESALMGTITCASPAYSFRKAIKHGENGFLAKRSEWFETLKYIYENYKNLRSIEENAKKYAVDNYSGKKIIQKIEDCFDFFLGKDG